MFSCFRSRISSEYYKNPSFWWGKGFKYDYFFYCGSKSINEFRVRHFLLPTNRTHFKVNYSAVSFFLNSLIVVALKNSAFFFQVWKLVRSFMWFEAFTWNWKFSCFFRQFERCFEHVRSPHHPVPFFAVTCTVCKIMYFYCTIYVSWFSTEGFFRQENNYDVSVLPETKRSADDVEYFTLDSQIRNTFCYFTTIPLDVIPYF